MRERMSGNISRCSACPNIVAAIADVAGARVKTFPTSATSFEGAAAAPASRPDTRVIAGRTNLPAPDEAAV